MLAAQLAHARTAVPLSLKTHSSTVSYLFSTKEADKHDLASLHSLAMNGFTKLKELDPRLARFEKPLFSDVASPLDRNMRSEEDNKQLNNSIGLFLRMIAPHFLEIPSSKVLEWLIRRFRINEFNVDDIMAAFLPFYESPHFIKMISILTRNSRLWSFLTGPINQRVLVNEMVKNSDLARFVVGILPEALQNATVHRSLVAFNASVLLDYIGSAELDQGKVAFILPAILAALKGEKDCVLGSLILVSALAQRSAWAPSAIVTVIELILQCKHKVKSKDIITPIVAILAAQASLDILPESTTNAIIALDEINVVLTNGQHYQASQKFYLPLIRRLCSMIDQDAGYSALEAIFSVSPPVNEIILPASSLLLELTCQRNDTTNRFRQLLSIVHQRHPLLFQNAVNEVQSSIEDNPSLTAMNQVVLSVVKPSVMASDDQNFDEMLACMNNADPVLRTMTITDLLKAIRMTPVPDQALKARVAEGFLSFMEHSDVPVLEVLYADASTILTVVPASDIIVAISKPLGTQDLSPDLIRLHLNFLKGEILTRHEDLTSLIFETILVPYLFISKPRQKSAGIVWDAISVSTLGDHPCLRGCGAIFTASSGSSDLAALNEAIIEKLADNILTSNNYFDHLTFFASKLGDANTHTRILAHVVLRSLLARLSGDHQIEAAFRILKAFALPSLDSLQDISTESQNLPDLGSNHILKAAVLKPTSIKNVHRLQASILLLIPRIERPVNTTLDWSENNRTGFVDLMRRIYSLANISKSFHTLSTHLTRALFINLAADSLLFLSWVWSNHDSSDFAYDNVRSSALSHASAFIKAHSSAREKAQDFQMILPFLLLTLQSSRRQVRVTTIDCINSLTAISTLCTSPPPIYGYAGASAAIQFLDWADVTKYVQSLSAQREHFVNDPDHMVAFHQTAFGNSKQDLAKEAGYNRRVLCYLLSYVVSWRGIATKVSLLRMLQDVTDRAKVTVLQPLFAELMPQVNDPISPICLAEESIRADYFRLLLGAFSGGEVVEDQTLNCWQDLYKILQSSFQSQAGQTLWNIAANQLQKIFSHLAIDQRIEVSSFFLHAVESPSGMKRSEIIKSILEPLLSEVHLVNSLLVKFQPSIKVPSRASKRTKLDSDTTSGGIQSLPSSNLESLTLLAEILGSKPLIGSVELLTTLLSTLGRVCSLYSPGRSDLDYLVQLLMTGLVKVAQGVTASQQGTTPVRVDVLVDLIRVSENPQTFHQALLLIADMAPLAPESVLHHIMPIFTFMGSNVFHRDDSYSFSVVQKTLENIVPVLVNSLKQKHVSTLDLVIASKPFLSVFTDAATHIPRHRRTQFFTHLVDVLGPTDFLAPFCMLLVDKTASKVARLAPKEVIPSLALPLTIFSHQDIATRIQALKSIAHECTRLVNESRGVETQVFLDDSRDSPVNDSSPAKAKRQLHALLLFMGQALAQLPHDASHSANESALQDLVPLLMSLATVVSNPQAVQITEAGRFVLNQALRSIAPRDFLTVVSSCLQSKDPSLQMVALDLLRERLPSVASETQQTLAPALNAVIDILRSFILDSTETSFLISTLTALAVITDQSTSQEVGALASLLSSVTAVKMDGPAGPAAMALLLNITTKLGPRLLPHLHNIIDLTTTVISNNLGNRDSVGKDSFKILLSMLTMMPTFWGTDGAKKALKLCIVIGDTPQWHAQAGTLSKTLVKKLPPKLVLKTLLAVWDELITNQELPNRDYFLQILKNALHRCPGRDITDNLRPLFKCFLDAFSISGYVTDPDSVAIIAFLELVVKLNESTFKPLFRRLLDWGYAPGSNVEYKTAFNYIMVALLGRLKGLVVPYMAMITDHIRGILSGFIESEDVNEALWNSIFLLLTSGFLFDEDGFWTHERLSTLMPLVVAQVGVCAATRMTESEHVLQHCLKSMLASLPNNSLVKAFNLEILALTRSEDTQTRILTLRCAEVLWREQGHLLVESLGDTLPIIHECADDENDDVAKEARKLCIILEKGPAWSA